MLENMKEDGNVADSSFGPPLGERAVWDMDGPDHECECPGPPPQFYLPPPPRPSSFIGSDCSENSISELETCEAVPVIDAEYHFSPAIPSLAIILIVVIAVVVFLFIGTLLVLLKKRSMQNLFPRKSSPQQNHCDAVTSNGVVYEDRDYIGNVRSRSLPSHCPGSQPTLPNVEMMDVAAYANHTMMSPVFICATSPLPDSTYHSQDLFNPVYEELSNGSGERGETDSEGMPRALISEDEFAEDELSLGGEAEGRRELTKRSGTSSLQEFLRNECCKDLDSSDADDRSKFLENPEQIFSLPPECREKGRKAQRGTHFHAALGRPRSLDRRKVWRSKGHSSQPLPPADCTEFHEGLLLKKILQIYPSVTGLTPPYSSRCGAPTVHGSPTGGGHYQSLASLADTHSRRQKPDVFSPLKMIQGSMENQSQDSLGSDSGYSNNTSGGNPVRGRKDCRLANHSDPIMT